MSEALRALAALERIAHTFGGDAAARKLESLVRLERGALPNAAAVARLHEVLCFLRAYPDSRPLEAVVTRMIEAFARRRDLSRFRARLVDSGISGTEIRFRFFSAMAAWLAERWPRQLEIDWRNFENQERLDVFLPLLALAGEWPGLDEYDLGTRGWLRAMTGPEGNEATFLVRRFHALAASGEVVERLWDELDPPMMLKPRFPGEAVRRPAGEAVRAIATASAGAAVTALDEPPTPSGTLAFHTRAPRALQLRPLSRARPDLAIELAGAPRPVRACSRAEGEQLIDLARSAMVTRSRDLDAFSYGDPADVRMVDCGDGLAFACVGVRPARRLMLEAVYAFLTLRNGVPIGYVLNSALFGSAEIAYNVFDTYRGAEAGPVYARVLAMVRHLFGAETFTIFPYQLGDGNDEALESGAWWFYRKFSFAPRDRATIALMRGEEARMKRRTSHRSSIATLRKLARENLYFSLGPARDDVIGRLPIASVGLAVTRFLAANWGAERERAERECAAEAVGLLGMEASSAAAEPASPSGWSAAERLWWRRWSPLVCILPGVSAWSPAEKSALAAVIRAKGGRRESDFVRAFDAHARLRDGVRALAERTRA